MYFQRSVRTNASGDLPNTGIRVIHLFLLRPTDCKHCLFNRRERPRNFPRRLAVRNAQRVTKTGYLPNSPWSVLASRRAWISSNRR